MADSPQQYVPGQGFVSNPRLAMAQALLAQGSSRAPVRSPLEGIARALQAGIGGWIGSGVKKDQQDALAEALKALEDPNVPETGRAKAAYQAYAAKMPDGQNPFESILLQQMVPKERFVEVKNAQGQVIGQRSTMSNKLEPFKLDSISPGQKSLNAFGEVVATGGPKLGEGQTLNPDGSVSTVPNFTNSMREIKEAEAGGAAQGRANVDLVMNPRIIRAETPARAAQAGAVTTANQSAELPFIAPRAAAQTAGAIEGQMRPVQTPEGPVPGVQAVKAAEAKPGEPDKLSGRAAKLRDDFNALPPVKAYREVLPTFQSMQDASTRDTKAADLNMVYGLAKIFDPGSVVREGEQVLVRDTASLPDWLVGSINSLNGGARLQAETRKALMDEAGSRFNAYKAQHDDYVARFTELAAREKVNPQDVIMQGVVPSLPAKPPAPPASEVTKTINGKTYVKRNGQWYEK